MSYVLTLNTNAGYSVGISYPTVSLTQSSNGQYALSLASSNRTASIGSTTYALSAALVGMQGDVGYVGSRGSVGFTGSIGFAGSVGFVGSVGNVGFTGSGGTGFTGSIGFTGSSGTGSSTSVGFEQNFLLMGA